MHAVTDTAPRIVYEPAPVLEAARQSYFNWDARVDISGADAAMVRLSTADAARADTIVEVSLAITPRGEGQPTAPTPAVRLVQAMLDKVG